MPLIDPIAEYKASTGFYPSNAQVWYLGKEADGDFSPTLLDTVFFGNTPAPKGHYILDLYTKNREAVSYVADVTSSDTVTTRPSTVAFYAGRAWYGGFPNSVAATSIYFSQTLSALHRAEKCYQEQDPTAEEFNSILATDGGVIELPECGAVRKLVVTNYALVVAAAKGIWEISGGSGIFSAENYLVNKITDIGCSSKRSVIAAEGAVYYWADSGIYTVVYDPESKTLRAVALTDDTIKSTYDAISSLARENVTAGYDRKAKKVYWLYNDSASYDGINNRFIYNKAVLLDILTGAFTIYSFADDASNALCGKIQVLVESASSTSAQVVDGEDIVLDNTDNVVESITARSSSTFSTKFLTRVLDAGEYRLTFSEFSNRDFKDWDTFYTSYLETADLALGDFMRNKDAPYVFSFFNRTEDGYELVGGDLTLRNQSACTLTAKWGWTGSSNSGKWTNPQQAYKLLRVYVPSGLGDPFDYGEDVIKTKLKLRGSGKAVRLRYESENGKDFQLLGYAMPVTAYEAV